MTVVSNEEPRVGDTIRFVVEGELTAQNQYEFTVGADDGPRSPYTIPRENVRELRILRRGTDPDIGSIYRAVPLSGAQNHAIKVSAEFTDHPEDRYAWVIVETGEFLRADNFDPDSNGPIGKVSS